MDGDLRLGSGAPASSRRPSREPARVQKAATKDFLVTLASRKIHAAAAHWRRRMLGGLRAHTFARAFTLNFAHGASACATFILAKSLSRLCGKHTESTHHGQRLPPLLHPRAAGVCNAARAPSGGAPGRAAIVWSCDRTNGGPARPIPAG